jgi:diphthamide synthase (EF-2-diphthine--ammonia ligase)
MSYALFWSGGKDSLLALDRAQQKGLEVTHLVNIYEGNTGRVRFHGVRKELLEAQAQALGLQLISEATHPRNFEAAFQPALQCLKQQHI